MPTDDKWLCLHGDNSKEMIQPQLLMFPVSGVEAQDVTGMGEAQFTAAVTDKGDIFVYLLVPDARLTTTVFIMKFDDTYSCVVFCMIGSRVTCMRLLCTSTYSNIMRQTIP